MKWMRYTALGIGIAFGLLFLTFGIGEGISEGFGGIPDAQDCVLLLFGPISMIAATAVAWKHGGKVTSNPTRYPGLSGRI